MQLIQAENELCLSLSLLSLLYFCHVGTLLIGAQTHIHTHIYTYWSA